MTSRVRGTSEENFLCRAQAFRRFFEDAETQFALKHLKEQAVLAIVEAKNDAEDLRACAELRAVYNLSLIHI